MADAPRQVILGVDTTPGSTSPACWTSSAARWASRPSRPPASATSGYWPGRRPRPARLCWGAGHRHLRRRPGPVLAGAGVASPTPPTPSRRPGGAGRRGQRHPKARSGIVEAIRVLRVARASAVKARTQAANQLRDLLLGTPEPLHAQP